MRIFFLIAIIVSLLSLGLYIGFSDATKGIYKERSDDFSGFEIDTIIYIKPDTTD
jgi:hypothetical protein